MVSYYKQIFILFVITVLIFAPIPIFAQTNCPKGLINDPAPGECGLYTDNDNNDVCDLSQVTGNTNLSETEGNCSNTVLSIPNSNISISHKDLKPKTVTEVAEIYNIPIPTFQKKLEAFLQVSVSPTDTLQTLHDTYGLEMSKVPELITSTEFKTPPLPLPVTTDSYNFFPISIITILLYCVTFLLAKMKKIALILHRKLWNYVLLISFIISGILGLLLTFRISTGINIPLPFNMLFWHVEAGIVMGIISIFHIVWHTRYFLPRSKSK